MSSAESSKITTAEVQATYVQRNPDVLTGTAQDNKKVFDALPLMIVDKHNELATVVATITSGEAPSAEEVMDARRGYDDTEYESLGNAIREQVSDAREDYTARIATVQGEIDDIESDISTIGDPITASEITEIVNGVGA
jgi:methionine synthase II (cobalamin-independent)